MLYRRTGAYSATAALALLYALSLAPGARADGDPASDTLYTQNVFLPYNAKIDPALAEELLQATAAAKSAGRPVRVALIAVPTDLGAVPSLYGRPKAYARFLGMELQFVYPGLLLVVMPQGAALSEGGRLVPNASVEHAKVQRSEDGLARAALALVRGLTASGPPSASGPTAEHRGVALWKVAALAAAIAGGIFGALLLGGLAVVRRRGRADRL